MTVESACAFNHSLARLSGIFEGSREATGVDGSAEYGKRLKGDLDGVGEKRDGGVGRGGWCAIEASDLTFSGIPTCLREYR